MVAVSAQGFCEVCLPEGAEPDATCKAKVSGYVVPSADVWSAAVCMLIMLTGAPAWAQAVHSDQGFRYALKKGGPGALLRCWGRPSLPKAAEDLFRKVLVLQPTSRPTAEESLCMAWLREDDLRRV